LPHFNREALSHALSNEGIGYAFLGNELGGRPTKRNLYSDGVADYEKMASSEPFKNGLELVVREAKKHRIAVMCSQHDPLDCHRCLLVARALAERGMAVGHMLSDGTVAAHAEIGDKLLEASGRSEDDLFATRAERLTMAYRERAQKVAFVQAQASPSGAIAAE
jgi:uncharacterized protein (DUF488 family)